MCVVTHVFNDSLMAIFKCWKEKLTGKNTRIMMIKKFGENIFAKYFVSFPQFCFITCAHRIPLINKNVSSYINGRNGTDSYGKNTWERK